MNKNGLPIKELLPFRGRVKLLCLKYSKTLEELTRKEIKKGNYRGKDLGTVDLDSEGKK